jgi:hypothetical protein
MAARTAFTDLGLFLLGLLVVVVVPVICQERIL